MTYSARALLGPLAVSVLVAAPGLVEAQPGGAADPSAVPDLTLRPPQAMTADEGGSPETPTLVSPAGEPTGQDVGNGFYRDRRGRVMQVSFDFGRRLWLGVGYAPRRRPTGESEIAPAAFDFGAAYDELSADGRTRHRFRILDGQVRLHPFGLDVTAFRYDFSHRYEQPLLRVTTLLGEPERHDLTLNIGLYTEAMRFVVAPRGIADEHELTLASLQGTLDFWQSEDLRSYVRLRVGPGAEMRIGPWSNEAQIVGVLPQGVLEGNLVLGNRALQHLSFRVRGNFFRTFTWSPATLPGNWLVDGEAAYEAILMAINDQPVSLRLAGQAGVREDAQVMAGLVAPGTGAAGWEWKGTAGIRMSFFSPPLSRRSR